MDAVPSTTPVYSRPVSPTDEPKTPFIRSGSNLRPVTHLTSPHNEELLKHFKDPTPAKCTKPMLTWKVKKPVSKSLGLSTPNENEDPWAAFDAYLAKSDAPTSAPQKEHRAFPSS